MALFLQNLMAVPPHTTLQSPCPCTLFCLLQIRARLGSFSRGYLVNADLGLVKVIPISWETRGQGRGCSGLPEPQFPQPKDGDDNGNT